LVTGNPDIFQRSVVDRSPGRSNTADLALAEHSRPQLGKDRTNRGDPGAPASEIGSHSLGTPGGGAILGQITAAGVLARWREDAGPVRATVPRPAKTLEEGGSPIVRRADGSGDGAARALTLKLHLISPIASADRGDGADRALPRCFGVGEKGYD